MSQNELYGELRSALNADKVDWVGVVEVLRQIEGRLRCSALHAALMNALGRDEVTAFAKAYAQDGSGWVFIGGNDGYSSRVYYNGIELEQVMSADLMVRPGQLVQLDLSVYASGFLADGDDIHIMEGE